jgi:hypothetical protein
MSKVDFATASIDEILRLYFTNGCIFLENFAQIGNLSELITFVDALYTEIDDVHICPRDLRQRGLSQFHEYLFEEKHYVLLHNIFNGVYRVSEDTVTRRIDSVARTEQWTAPLGPHLDAFIHSFAFTVNFWIPFRECGVEAPSLGVVRAAFPEICAFPVMMGTQKLTVLPVSGIYLALTGRCAGSSATRASRRSSNFGSCLVIASGPPPTH